MNFLSDFTAINKVVIKKTSQSYMKNLIMIPLLATYYLAYQIVVLLLNITIGQFGAGGSFIASILGWFIMCFFLSDFLTQFERILAGKKFTFSDLGRNYMNHFSPLLSATAIPNIVIYLFTMLTVGTISVSPMLLYGFYALYAIPEVVYQKNKDRLDIFVYGHHFIKENWQQWLPINLIILVLMYTFTTIINQVVLMPIFEQLTIIFNTGYDNLFINLVMLFLRYLILAIPLVYYLIYRGYTFKILSVSSRRKREYMRNIYGK